MGRALQPGEFGGETLGRGRIAVRQAGYEIGTVKILPRRDLAVSHRLGSAMLTQRLGLAATQVQATPRDVRVPIRVQRVQVHGFADAASPSRLVPM